MALEISGIQGIPSQEFQFNIEDGTITFSLYYKSASKMWMMDILFKEIYIYSLRVCSSYNLLEQFSNLLPFGLFVSNNTNKGYEPNVIDDFSSKRFTLNILDKEEVESISNFYSDLREY